MSLKKKIISSLPDSWQDYILAKVIASNKWSRIPTFKMLFESFILMGGDRKDIVEVFSESTDLGPNFYQTARLIAKKREEIAKKDESNNNRTRIEYQKALVLYFLADWVSFEMTQLTQNYADLLRISNKVDSLAIIPTKKISLDWEEGTIACRYRTPNSKDSKIPLVMLVQGNDTIKEVLIMVEDYILENGIAVLNIDQSGWGESLISGNHFESLLDARKITQKAFKFFKTQDLIDLNRIGIFGFSGGGTWAAMIASQCPEIRFMVSVGGAIFKLENSINGLPAMQKRQVMKHWGVSKKGIRNILPSLNFTELLPSIRSSVLLVHGIEDTLIPVKYVEKAARLMQGSVQTCFVPGGDHMCSETLKDVQLPFIMQWFREKFQMDISPN